MACVGDEGNSGGGGGGDGGRGVVGGSVVTGLVLRFFEEGDTEGGPGVVGAVLFGSFVIVGADGFVACAGVVGLVIRVIGVGLASMSIADVGDGMPSELSGAPGGPTVVGTVGDTGASVTR